MYTTNQSMASVHIYYALAKSTISLPWWSVVYELVVKPQPRTNTTDHLLHCGHTGRSESISRKE